MKIEEAIWHYNALKEHYLSSMSFLVRDRTDEISKEVIAALEKQIPKKPIICGENPDGTYQFKCPECGRLWWEKSYITNYCDKCGNLIDRSDPKHD